MPGRKCCTSGKPAACAGAALGLLSDAERARLARLRDISRAGASASSPPSPMISGGVCTNRTTKSFLLLGLPLEVNGNGGGRPFCAVTALLNCVASGHLCAAAMSSFGFVDGRVPAPEYFSVDGFRKSTTSLFKITLLFESPGPFSSFLKTFPHLDLNLLLLGAASSVMAEVLAFSGSDAGTRAGVVTAIGCLLSRCAGGTLFLSCCRCRCQTAEARERSRREKARVHPKD